MNVQTLFTFYLINSQAQFKDRNINEEIANSLIYVIEQYFEPRDSSFIICLSFERENTRDFYQDLSEILFLSYDNIKTQIVVRDDIGFGTIPTVTGIMTAFNFHMVVVDSVKSFLNIDLASKVKNYDTNEFYHIFLHNKDRYLDIDIRTILSYCWSHYIINVNVVIQTASGDIIVYTYFPFSESHCYEVIPVEINRFKNGMMVNSDLFPQKLQNMHKCPVRVAPFHTPPFFSLHSGQNNATEEIGGFEGHLLKELSLLMNFTIEIILPPSGKAERGSIFSNYTTGAINMLVNRKVDLSLGNFWFATDRSQILTASYSYFQTSNVAVLMKNSLDYKSPYVLWFPYKFGASILIITSFVIMLSLVYVFEKLSSVNLFPVIKPNRGRCLNFIAWTLGLPSHTLPTQLSKRIFIMTWMLFGLVIRSQYAGVIFHLLRNNLFRRSPSTISEVKSLDYTIILSKPAYESLIGTSIFSDTGLRHRIIDNDVYERSLFAYLEEHPRERLFVISPLGSLLHYLDEQRKADVLTILKESFMRQNLCMYFSKHSFLVNQVNLLIQRIDSAGIIKFWIYKQIDWSYIKKSSGQSHEIVIGQSELIGIYYIWLTMMSVAVLVFCLEKVAVKFRLLQRIFEKI